MSKRELVEVTLEPFGFSFDVVKLPEEVVVDKLALFSSDTGLISRIEYQNYLFSETVLNLERLFHFIVETTGGDIGETIEMRHLVEEKIIGVNPSLDPNTLVITKTGVIKPAVLGEGIPLPNNGDWGKIIEDINPYIDIEEIELTDEDPDADPPQDPPPGQITLDSPIFSANVPTEKVLWERTNIEVGILKYNKEHVPAIFSPVVSIPDEFSFHVFVIKVCIPTSLALFTLVDTIGLTEELTAPAITKEIYELCIKVNPFLKYSEIDLSAIRRLPRPPAQGTSPLRQKKKSKKIERKSEKDFKSVTKADLLTLAARMKGKIIGQNEAIDQIVETVQVASCGLRDPDKPIAVYMLCGKTGTGKTLTSKVLAEELCGSRDAIVRIDCSEYTEPHSVQKLIGAPPSYVGYEDGGFLTNAVQEHPFSIVLFDEIEKAHSKLFDMLLQIMDDSRLTDGKGNVTSFKDCIILLTSNIGVAESEAVKGTMGFGDEGVLTDARRHDALKKALKAKFRPEFLNRVDNTISFRGLSKDDGIQIVSLLLQKLNVLLEKRNITAEFSESVKAMVFEKGFSSKFGARPLERTIEREVVKPLAQMILKDEIADGTSIKIDYKKDKLVVKESKLKLSAAKRTVIKV